MDEKIYRLISRVFSAPLFPLFVVLAFVYLSPGGGLNPFQSILVGWTFLSWIPITVLIFARRTGFVDDFGVPRREKRNRIFVLVIVSYLISAAVFHHFSNYLLFLISLAYVVVTSSMTLINIFWKISIHVAGIAGPTTALVYVFGPKFSVLYLLLIPICVSRYRLKAHSKLQLIGGSVPPMAITWALYLAFY